MLQIIASMENGQTIKQSQIQVKTDLRALNEILQWFEQFNLAAYVPSNLWWHETALALAEGFTNAVRHAHCGLPPQTPIKIEVTLFAHCLEMRIWDYGQPFNLEEKITYALCHPPRDPLEKESGRGLIWMYQLTNNLHYIRTNDERNCLVMRKKIRQ